MGKEEILIRAATTYDAEKILEIYAPYVRKTAITFEYDVPEPEDFRDRMRDILKKYPYIVAERNGEILGFAYTSTFKGRAAYDWAAETSIYVKESKRKTGIGKRLYNVLEGISKTQNILNLNACIAYPETEDEYLTKNSVHFHEHLGYQEVGVFHKCGYKFGIWYNMMWMEKLIGEHSDNPHAVIPFPELEAETLRRLGMSAL
ncbi:MAG: GNAT family N-acetyltransferase [Eubacteriales bacterium]|nr:GNAT family N-acetyltransferase [Eubacteriales bacterium]